MRLVKNVKKDLILTKSPTYSPWFFLKIGPFLTLQKYPNKIPSLKGFTKELSNSVISFEIRHS